MNHDHTSHSDHASSDHDHAGDSAMNHDGADHAHHGSADHASTNHAHHGTDFKRKFFICLILAIPVIILSPFMGLQLPFTVTFPGSDWVVVALSTVLYFYGGSPFLIGAKDELKQKRPAMMTLISLGITVAYAYSLYAFAMNTFVMGEHAGESHVMDFFWELATLIVIMLLGHWVEMKAVVGAGDSLQKMARLLPSQASVRQPDGSFTSIPLPELNPGQFVMVKAGENMPADGIVVEGETSVDESMVTGESKEVVKQLNDIVIGGSRNGAGSIVVKVTGTGESGYLAQVMQLVRSAQQERSKAETLSDKVARLLFYVAVAVGVVALIVWFALTQDFGEALTRMVTVLVIACPHALGLAIPLVVARSISLGAQRGLLVRDRKALEEATKVNVVMMDKTGTLTEGDFKVVGVVSIDERYSEDDVLSYAAALEAGSSHPLATGILREAGKRALPARRAQAIKTIPGVGLEGVAESGHKLAVVTAAYLEKNAIPFDEKSYRDLVEKGYTASFVTVDGAPIGFIAQGDEVRPEAARLIQALKGKGIQAMMLTGDNESVAAKTAFRIGLDAYKAALLPEDKESIVRQRREAGDIVMMVGDGVNDAPSLVRANVGVAIGAGTDVAVDSADVVLVRSDPADILHFLSLAENTTRKMVQNLWWGAGYNIVAIPLAAGVLAPLGILLSPAVGAILMSLSTVIVAVNALSLTVKE